MNRSIVKIRCWLLALVAALACPGAAGDALAAERTQAWREFLYLTGSETIDLGDPGQRAVGVWQSRGLAVFPDGDVARILSAGTVDVQRGLGSYEGDVLYIFDDGSTKSGRIRGRIVERTGDGGNLQEGVLNYVGGTGRFDGITGQGSYTARQYGPAGDGGETIVDVSATQVLRD